MMDRNSQCLHFSGEFFLKERIENRMDGAEVEIEDDFFDGRTSLLFSCSIMSDSLQPHGLQHARLPCPPPAPGVSSNSCPSTQ